MKRTCAIAIIAMIILFPFQRVRAEEWISAVDNTKLNQEVRRDLETWLDMIHSDKIDLKQVTTIFEKYPNWPLKNDSLNKAELISLGDDISESIALKFYQKFPPKTDQGQFKHIIILAKNTDQDTVLSTLKKYWRAGSFDHDQQELILHRWYDHLTQDDHITRAKNLIVIERSARAEQAITYVSSQSERQSLLTQLALLTNSPKADYKYQALPDNLKNKSAMRYARLKYLRQAKKNDQAAEFILSDTNSPKNFDKKWWRERHILARRALNEKRYQDAYDLIHGHGYETGIEMAEGEWLAGWLSLKYLNRPDQALSHFEKMYQNVQTPISKSRSAYGAGLAAKDLQNEIKSQEWLNRSAENIQTFYGQKSLQELGLETDKSVESFLQNQPKQLDHIVVNPQILSKYLSYQIGAYLHKKGLYKERDLFLRPLIWQLKDLEEQKALLQSCHEMRAQMICLSLAKRLAGQNIVIINHLFPKLEFEIESIINSALVYAIIRQESLFDLYAESRAGALGLMQLMPATAQAEAKANSIEHQENWLLSRPKHNVKLGQLYLKKMIERYNGSIILAVAAYNAGPGNVDKWLVSIGDPALMDDPIEWIEKIPFKETRNYVQRVLESYVIYQNR